LSNAGEATLDAQVLQRERDGHVVTLTLNRPEKRNAINVPMLEALEAAFREADAERDVRAIILAGAGKAFCSGLDLKEMGLARRPDGGVEYPGIEDALHQLELCPVPTIAMIQGEAIAGGLELALHCDLRIAGASARLGMPLARIGLVVPFALTQKLLDTVGTATTKELLFTGERAGRRPSESRRARRRAGRDDAGPRSRDRRQRPALDPRHEGGDSRGEPLSRPHALARARGGGRRRPAQ
jgi:enoyl-CoA hydratase/carnithine racemase